jgi:hypothetical protein
MKTTSLSLLVSFVLFAALPVHAGETNASVHVSKGVTATNATAVATSTNSHDLNVNIVSPEVINRVAAELNKSEPSWRPISGWRLASSKVTVPNPRVYDQADWSLVSVGKGSVNVTIWSDNPVGSVGPEVGYMAGGLSFSIPSKK